MSQGFPGKLSRALSDRIWALRQPRIGQLYYTQGGLGDELLLTAVAEAAAREGRPLHILTHLPEVWEGNAAPASVHTAFQRWLYAACTRKWLKTHILHLSYDSTKPEHIARQMASGAGLTLPNDWRPIFKVRGPLPAQPRLLVLHNSCRGARFAAETKEWPAERWQLLVDRLSPDWDIIQLGTPNDPPLRGTRDLRGKTSLQEAAALLQSARLFIGLESGLMHLAAATQTPAVILHGGRTRVSTTAYPGNTHLATTPDCAGCGLNTGCPRAVACMDIPVETVETAIRQQLLAPR